MCARLEDETFFDDPEGYRLAKENNAEVLAAPVTPPEGLAVDMRKLSDYLKNRAWEPTPDADLCNDPDLDEAADNLLAWANQIDAAATQRAPVSTPILSDIQPWPGYCFECDDTSRCCSAELCYAGHKEYPKDKHEKGQRAPVEQGREFDFEAIGDAIDRVLAGQRELTPAEQKNLRGIYSKLFTKLKPASDHAREGALRSETPETDLARWIWQRFVGCPVAGVEYEKEFRLLLLKVANYTDEIERRRALADGKEGGE